MYANVHSMVQDEQKHVKHAGRTAVILNANAKKVGSKVQRQIRESLPKGADLFLTDSLEQAEFTIRRVVDSGYQTIVTGGGDGTVAHAIHTALSRREQKGYSHCPRFAVLKLGTGNAVADYLGARQFRTELQTLDQATFRWLDLLKVNGRRATFAGIGWDAYILNNYDNMRRVAERFAPTRAIFKSVAGYLAAGVLKSAPELAIKRPSWNVRVYNTGGFGLKLDPSGRVMERVAPGSLIYEGPIRMACVGTTPFYGFKLNIMPFADTKEGLFHLRLIDMHPLYAITRLPKIWKGHLNHPRLRDFQLSGCRIESDEPAPFQIAGDAAGETHRIDVGLEHPVRCASFTAR